MFGLRCFRQKKNQRPAEDESKQRLSSRRSVAATKSPVSAKSAEAGKHKKTKRAPWRSVLFGHRDKQTNQKEHIGREDSTSGTIVTAKSTEPDQTANKPCWWRQLFKCCKRRHRVGPASNNNGEKKPQRRSRPGTPKETNEPRESSSFYRQDEVVPFHTAPEESSALLKGQQDISEDYLLLPEVPDDDDDVMMQAIIKVLLKEEFNSITRSHIGGGDGAKQSSITIDRFGFPNIGQSCYLNSSLQSLLTLADFIRDLSCQEPVWSSVPEAQLLRRFMAIRDAHTSTNSQSKTGLLSSFKEAISVQAPEFSDRQQKDAHEFLTSVLDQIRRLSPLLQDKAASMGRRYTCPVEDHLVFKMENTRTCKRCGAQSKRQEDFTNLSLDLVPGGSVEEILEGYLMETELEYKCECGGTTSGQRSAFETLPNVLVLHLKRFRFTSCFELVKVHDPVVLLRDLVVSSKQGGGCFSLVSAISHYGFTGEAGHYICDGVHPDDRSDEPTDRWLTFNDSAVTETTGTSVCEQRQESAYILVYKRLV